MYITKTHNFIGAPSSGKSTAASHNYAVMKRAGLSVEIVNEYAKSWAYQKRKIERFDQYYFLGKQLHYLSRLDGKVENIITDSPVILSYIYEDFYFKTNYCLPIVEFYLDQTLHKSEYYLLKINKDRYQTEGRYQTLDEALEIESKIIDFMDSKMIKYNCIGEI